MATQARVRQTRKASRADTESREEISHPVPTALRPQDELVRQQRRTPSSGPSHCHQKTFARAVSRNWALVVP